ncbi:MAG TPA: ABC transporter permease [Polyangia bacterium]|nr:ABC transporter permease [Polyangia bacterium]
MRLLVEGRAALRTAVRGVAQNRMRAFLSILGITIGVATLTAITSITQGLGSSFAQQLAQLGANTLYITSRPWVMRGDWWRYRNRPKITRADADALSRRADLLTAVAPVVFTPADVSYQSEHSLSVDVRGTNEQYIDTTNIHLAEGRFLSPIDVEYERRVAVIGSDLEDRLFHSASPLGAEVAIGGQPFRVIGLLKAQGRAFGRSLDNVVVVPLGAFGRVFGHQRDQAIAVAAPPEKLAQAEEQVIEVLRRARGLQAQQEDTFAINQQAALVRMFQSDTAALFGVGIAVGLITLLVGGIGVMNIMLVAVTERTREIGVRRALGARRRTILMQFLIEASVVTLVGGAIGTTLGMGGAQLFALTTPVPAVATPQAIVLGLVVSATVGVGFGTWPAWRAARLDPIESLRYE